MNRTARAVLGLTVLGWVTVGCSDSSNPVGVSAADRTTPSVLKLAAEETIGFAAIPAGTVDPVINVNTGTVTTAATGCVDIATIYDTAAATGVDPDLDNQSQQGNVLIVEENDGDGVFVESPDDCFSGGTLTLDFSGVGPLGTVTLEAAKVLDIEAAGVSKIELFGPASGGAPLLFTVFLPVTSPPPSGDGGIATVGLGPTSGVETMVVTFDTSGAIDDIEFSPDRGGEGCTPGRWKNWTGLGRGNQTDNWSATGVAPPGPAVGATFVGVVASLAGENWLQALQGGGGSGIEGKQEILLRAAVGALLNALHPDVAYPLTPGEIIAMVNGAIAAATPTDTSPLTDLADELDDFNNLGCSLTR